MLRTNTPDIEIFDNPADGEGELKATGYLETKFACPKCGDTAIVYMQPYGIEWDSKPTKLEDLK